MSYSQQMVRELSAAELATLRATLDEQGRLAALALYRTQTAAPLQDARAMIEALETGAVVLTTAENQPAPLELPADISELPEVRAALLDLNKYGAIQALREFGAGLEQAVEAVDNWIEAAAVNAPPSPPELLQSSVDLLTGMSRRPELLRQYRVSADRWNEAERLAAVGRVQLLMDRSYRLCDQYRDGQFDQAELQRRLRSESPGFSEAIYSAVYNYSMFVSR